MDIFIAGLKVPVNPKTLTVAQNQKIETVEVLNAGEIPIPGFSELQNISFESFVPSQKDGNYAVSSRDPNGFINTLHDKKNKNEPVRVIISGIIGSSIQNGNVNQEYLIENFTFSTEYGYHNDIKYSISLKQYRKLQPRKLQIKQEEQVVEKPPQPNKEEPREATTPPKEPDEPVRTHTVVKGDTLWGLARKYYGDGVKWEEVYKANGKEIDDPHWIYPGQEFIIP